MSFPCLLAIVCDPITGLWQGPASRRRTLLPSLNNISTKQLRQEILTLSKKAYAFTKDDSLSFAEVKKNLAPLEAQLQPLVDELESRDYVAVQRKKYGIDEIGSSREYATTAKGLRTKNAPTLDLSPAHQAALFRGLSDQVPVTVKAGVPIESGDLGLLPEPVGPPLSVAFEPNRIMNMIPSAATTSPVIQYRVANGTNNAGAVGEGELKPASDLGLVPHTLGMTKIAHWTEVTEEALEDYPAFAQFLTSFMIAGVVDAENRELLFGSGLDDHKFEGLMVVDGTQTYEKASDETILDALDIAGEGLRSSGRYIEPDTYVMHPLDFGIARRTKDSTGKYIAGDPTQSAIKQLWGHEVVLTTEMTRGIAVVANFGVAAEVYIRAGLSIRTNQWGGSDSFQRNKQEIVAEERLGLAVVAPSAISIVGLT
ncbi:hypothetical protein BH09ACT6_BH09ACT6_18680 [soil metagenome]